MTYREIQEYLRPLGVVMSKKSGKIRLNNFGGLEETARYSETLEGALSIGIAMASSRGDAIL